MDVTAPVRNRFYVNLDEVRTERLTLIDPQATFNFLDNGRSCKFWVARREPVSNVFNGYVELP